MLTSRWITRGRVRSLIIALAVVTLAVLPRQFASAQSVASPSVGANSSDSAAGKPTIVFVHGDWADGSGWSGEVARLQELGYTVRVPANPLRGPNEDAAYIASFLNSIAGPIVLVAHSYGGFVITNAATGNPNVRALVYVDAFIPDLGQKFTDLAAGSCVGGDPTKTFSFVPIPGGLDLYLQSAPNPPYPGFAQCFANGVDAEQIPILWASQRPASANEFSEVSGAPAWKTIPSWDLIGTRDHVIPEAAQRAMAATAHSRISTFDAGHLGLITEPDVVVDVVLRAIRATR
jgi:pimeloyl-ACP methyl ester carboxylesterase